MAQLSLQADYTQLSAIRAFVEKTSRDMGLDERSSYELQLAIDEACTNIIEHGYDEQAGPIEIQIELVQDGVEVVIRDWGRAFDPESVPCPDVGAPLEQRPLGGVGLFLMRKLMDQVDFQFDKDRGNKLTMFKRVAGGDDGN